MPNPPHNHNICPCCGTEFNYDDCTLTVEELRKEWVQNGAAWFHSEVGPPPKWNWFKQLSEAGLIATDVRADAANMRNYSETANPAPISKEQIPEFEVHIA